MILFLNCQKREKSNRFSQNQKVRYGKVLIIEALFVCIPLWLGERGRGEWVLYLSQMLIFQLFLQVTYLCVIVATDQLFSSQGQVYETKYSRMVQVKFVEVRL